MHHHAIFKHLLLALSAAHSFGNPDGSNATRCFGLPAENEAFLLEHYGKALSFLSAGEVDLDITLVLGSALCLCVIEGCRHKPQALLSHLKGGTKLLNHYYSSSALGPTQLYIIGYSAIQA